MTDYTTETKMTAKVVEYVYWGDVTNGSDKIHADGYQFASVEDGD